jgi:hypothetical protein
MKNIESQYPMKVRMEPLASILTTLTASGYTVQFQATEHGLLSLKTREVFQPGDVKIVHFYRFEGESNPDDNSILYAIETSNGELGTLVDAYGLYSDPQISSFIQQVSSIHK